MKVWAPDVADQRWTRPATLARGRAALVGMVSSPKLVAAVLLLLPALAALFFLVEAARFLPVRGDNTWAEAHGVLIARRWASGMPLYSDFQQPPYIWTSFPPLWYALLALAHRAGVRDLDTLTLLGRLITLASLAGLAALAYSWSRHRGFDRASSLSSPVFYLALPILMPWAVSARPDVPALFLVFLAVYIAARRSTPAMVGLAGLLGGLAFLMKHSFLAGPLAIGLWLLGRQRWRAAIVFGLTWALTVGATLVGFEIASGGLLSVNFRGSHVGAFALANMKQIVIGALAAPGHGFAMALLALGLFGVVHGAEHRDRLLLALYGGLSAALALFTAGFANAGENHFLEVALVAATFVPVAIAHVRGLHRGQPLLSLVLLLSLSLLVPSLDLLRWRMLSQEPADFHRLVPLVRRGRVLTDIPYLAARTPSLELLEPIAMTHKERVGGWSSRPIVEAISGQAYDLVVLDRELGDPRWDRGRNLFLSSTVRAAIAARYGFCWERDAAYVYGPLRARAGAPPAVDCPDAGTVPARVAR